MTLTFPLWFLWTVCTVLIVITALLMVGLLIQGEVVERRLERDRKGSAVAFASMMAGGVNPMAGRSRRFQELIAIKTSSSVSGAELDALNRWCDEVGLVEQAVRWTDGWSWTTRARGVRLLASLGREREVLLALLADRHPQVRQQAAEYAPLKMGDSRLVALVTLFGDPDPGVRFAAMDNVARCGRAAGPVLARALFLTDRKDVLLAAMRVCLATPSDAFAAEIIQLCGDPDPEVRCAAIKLIPIIPAATARAPKRLIIALDDPDPGNRAVAAEGLGMMKHLPAASRLSLAMRDQSWDVRRASAIALYGMGPSGQVILRSLTRSPDRYAADMARLVLTASKLGEM